MLLDRQSPQQGIPKLGIVDRLREEERGGSAECIGLQQIRVARDHEDRQPGPLGTGKAGDRRRVGVRRRELRHQRVRHGFVCKARDGSGAVPRDFHREAILAQHLRQAARGPQVVIDQQHQPRWGLSVGWHRLGSLQFAGQRFRNAFLRCIRLGTRAKSQFPGAGRGWSAMVTRFFFANAQLLRVADR